MEAALRRDVESLAAMERDTAGEGERQAARWAAVRLEQAGATDVRVEPYRYQRHWAHGQVPAHAVGLVGAALGGPVGAGLALAGLTLFDLDYTGRAQPLRRLTPSGDGANAVGRIPARGERRLTLVLTAHLDGAHTGLIWQADPAAHLAARTNRHPSLGGGVVPGYLLAFAGSGLGNRRLRVAGAATLGLAVALSLQSAASATVPAANDNATGVAALLALLERLAAGRPDGLEVIALVNGSEESGMGGMRAFLDGEELDPRSTLVLGFDSMGSGEVVLLESEAGPVTKVRYREADLDLADRGTRRAGEPELRRFGLGAWTDPALAVHRGIPAISLLSLEPGGGRITNYHRMSDTAENVDYRCVARSVRIAAGIAEEFGTT